MPHLLTLDEVAIAAYQNPQHNQFVLVIQAQLRKTLSELSAFPGDLRYVSVPREWIEEAKKELGE